MAGSRVEKLGSIFSRVHGLLRTGAIKEVEKPLWYDVYAAFPPKVEPSLERMIQTQRQPMSILYKEDVIRAQFYNTYGSPDTMDMTDSDTPSISQRFVQKYQEMEKGMSGEEEEGDAVFTAAASALKTEGTRLRTLQEIQEEKDARKAAFESKQQSNPEASVSHHPTAEEVFGFAEELSDGAEDFVNEDALDPKPR